MPHFRNRTAESQEKQFKIGFSPIGFDSIPSSVLEVFFLR